MSEEPGSAEAVRKSRKARAVPILSVAPGDFPTHLTTITPLEAPSKEGLLPEIPARVPSKANSTSSWEISTDSSARSGSILLNHTGPLAHVLSSPIIPRGKEPQDVSK